jgi:NAD+ kinase
MTGQFPRIGIFSKPTGDGITEALVQICTFLEQRGHNVVLDKISATRLPNSKIAKATDNDIGKLCDLVIVIGGDGSLLKAARAIVDAQIPILGVNRGNLGFLADVTASNLETALDEILAGEYVEEQRTMLNASVIQNSKLIPGHLALNDIVLHHGELARLIDFQMFIDDQFVVDQRADGVITSTPTGSTAYALSGGGPIVYPTLDVITLLPMFPHALNTRPIVIDKKSKIRLVLNASNRLAAQFSADGQSQMTLHAGDEIHIEANKNNLRLLHPLSYNYFALLREKLGWNLKLNK